MQTAIFDRALINELNRMMQELYDLVSQLQTPKPRKQKWKQEVRERCEELVEQISEFLDLIGQRIDLYEEKLSERFTNLRDDWHQTWNEKRDSLQLTLEEISEKLRLYYEELGRRPRVKRLKSLYNTISEGYEELVDEIRVLKNAGLLSTARARHLKPINYKRNLFHVVQGISGVLIYAFLISRATAITIMISLMSTAIILEITRNIWPKWNDFLIDRVFGLVSRPHERKQITGATWFTVALTLLVSVFPKNVVLASVLVLALADPAASMAGKLWGTKKIIGSKSYIGSLAFMIVAFAVVFPFMLYVHSLFYSLFAALIVALTGTLAELFVTLVDDNFTIPVACSIIFFLLL